MKRASNVAILAGLVLLAGAGSASADTYVVSLGECGADNSSPFSFFADLGMRADADCESMEQVTVLAQSGPTALAGATARAALRAPDGVTLEHLDWNGAWERADCDWDVLLRAGGVYRGGVGAFQDCDVGGWVNYERLDLDGASDLVLEVSCRAPEHCPVTFPSDLWSPVSEGIFIFRGTRLTAHDATNPRVELLEVAGGNWVRGVQPIRYTAQDNTGIREMFLRVAGHSEHRTATCDYRRLDPCPQGGGELPLDTTRLTDGVHPLTVEAVDAGSNTGSDTTSAYIDNTAPERIQPFVEGGSAWRSTNAFTVAWHAAPERHAPIAAAHYRLCRPSTSECVRGSRASADGLADLRVPGPGEWTLETWREDAAGNVDERQASPPVLLRFDDAPPTVALEPRQPEDPRRVSAVVGDGVSGVASGEIQLRPAETRTWRSLPTRLDRGRLTAEVDDDGGLPAGRYELRAVARDHAGNEGSTDGSALQLPLRDRARLTAGVVKTRAKREPRLLRSATVGFDDAVRLSGRLTNALGRAVPGARLYVTSQSRVGGERAAGAVTTNRAGEFTYRMRARASATVRIRYHGSRMLGPAGRDVGLEVPAASVLRVNRRRVLNGDKVVFTGRLRGRPFPRPGKIIHLQADLPRKGWTNFDKPHRAEPNGRWRIPYRFDNTRGVVRYRFRVLVPREHDYPFGTGASNVVRVTVRGR